VIQDILAIAGAEVEATKNHEELGIKIGYARGVGGFGAFLLMMLLISASAFCTDSQCGQVGCGHRG